MKFTCLLAAIVLLTAWPSAAASRDREDAWKRVDDAAAKGLPQTAIKELEPIIGGALADRAWPEAIKAITRKLAFEDEIQGGQAAGKIRRLEAMMPQLPREMAPVLQTILADWYWSYFRMNRWRFAQRTATAVPPGADFESWDLPRLFAAIDQQFTTALAAERLLQTIPIATYDSLLTRGTLPDTYRPTLYDFVAHEALEFYTAGEQAGALPEDAFEVAATTPALGSREEFLAWQPMPPAGAPARVPPGVKAIQLYQALLRFHARDADPTASLDVDLARLLWAKNVAFGEEKGDRFKAAMQAIAAAHGDHDLASMALFHQANELKAEGDLSAAHEIAARARQIHPQSAGGRLAANLIAEIEAPSASITTERIWNRPWPTIRVRYRNVAQVHFRLIAANWDDYLDRKHSRPESLRDDERAEVLTRPVARRWSAMLPATERYREQEFEVPIPEDLTPGFYFLVASHQEDFSEAKNQLSLTDVWVSDLALVIRPDAAELGGFVLEAGSGEPITGARIQAWYLNRQGERVPVPEVVTDALGAFTLPLANQRNYVVKATARGQSVAARDQFNGWNSAPRLGAIERTLIFTDRSIYRPGQTVQYKGICYRGDQGNDTYTVQSGRALTIVFTDANRKEIARQRHVANDYGSFSGSFTAPRDRLPGQMQLRIIEGPLGQTMVSVEEYKRPKFEVVLDAPQAGGKLDEKIQLNGRATSYTGAAIDGAAVKFRVVRAVRWPWWWGWGGFRRGGPGRGESQEIMHGTARTDAGGAFSIEFVAKPDRQAPAADEPVFVFEVYADVTDSAGETRSESRRVQIGYSAIEARLTADEWQTADRPVELRVETTNLDGEPLAAEGVVRVLALKAPERVVRSRLDGRGEPVPFAVAGDDAPAEVPDLSDPATWETTSVVAEQGFTTDAKGRTSVKVTLPVGAFRAVLECQDRDGRKVTGRLPLTVVQPAGNRLGIPIPNHLGSPAWEVESGTEFTALWGTGYEPGRAYVEVEHRGKVLQRFWTPAGASQAMIRQAVDEGMRGGFTLHVFQVRENRAYLHSRQVEVPWSNKELTLQWEHFTSKLQPGQKETWSLVIKPKVTDAAATNAGFPELVATLYDRSLDAFMSHDWPDGFRVFRENLLRRGAIFANGMSALAVFRQDWAVAQETVEATYRDFPPELIELPMPGRPMKTMRGGIAARPMAMESMVVNSPAPAMALAEAPAMAKGAALLAADAGELAPVITGSKMAEGSEPPVALATVAARRNLNETAFFYPQLVADASGVVRLTFTLPEALTEWRFLGFAHDRALRAGLLEGRAKAVKDIMVQPNPPRFLREGDVVEFAVKVSNLSDQPQRGRARLTFTEGVSDRSADTLLGHRDVERPFELAAKASTTLTWRLTVSEGLSTLSYKAVAAAAGGSDGEEGWLPVLSRRVLITESLPLPIVGPATNRFEFTRLLEAGKSKTLRHQGLTLQMVSNPAWYAVLALPYLMEYPHECSEQTFNRFYANAVARLVAQADPKIRRVFDQWKATPALESPLSRNPELKSLLLEESPWLREAEAESEARRNVGVLFDDNRLMLEQDQAWQRVKALQLPDGAWPWFPGGPANDYITLYLVTGMGRLRQLGLDFEVAPALKALDRLDAWIEETHREILKRQNVAGSSHLTPTVALYLYARSFYLRDKPIAPAHQAAIDYFLDQARRYAIPVGIRQSQAHLALALHRWGDAETPAAILKSLKEKSVVSDELGRSWREVGGSWGWQDAPIETQATLIEAFDEIAHDAAVVDGCQVWLLKQKQTQDWRTTKATADAVYALLRRGRNPLAADQLVEVDLGGTAVGPVTATGSSALRGTTGAKPRSTAAPTTTPEPGTGYYERHWSGSEIKPSLGKVTTRKRDRGVAWGSLHWQYLEDLDKVTPARNTPIKLRKEVLVRRNTINGPVLEPINGPVAVGDELVVRIELRLDRDMEFVHLKDQRGSGTEPVNVLSGYKYQDGLGYYEATRDTASHFFFDRLPTGVHVIEYALRVQLRGEYGAGVATAQCLYAPEFNTHSGSVPLVVK